MVTEEGRWSELFSGRNAASAFVLSVGVVLHAINIYISTTILPSVVAEIGGLELYAWNTTLFVVASIVGSVLSTRLLARFGARAAYLVAGLIFMLGSLLCAIAPSMLFMLLGRTIQGMGGGFLFALSYTMIHQVFREALWPRAMALTSAMWGIATLVGPAVGGIFAEMAAWRLAFGILVPITMLYILTCVRMLPAQRQQNMAQPIAGVQLLLLVLVVLLLSAGSLSATLTGGLAALLIALLLIGVLCWRESRADVRLLPRGALRPGAPLAVLYATMALLCIAMTSEVFVPYFLQILHGQTPLIAGYIAAMMAAGWTLSEILSSGWRARGIRFAIISGPILLMSGLMLLAGVMPGESTGTDSRLLLVMLGLTLIGFGIGFGWPHLLTRILQVSPPEDKELAGASLTTVQSFATAIGAALVGMLANLAGLSEPGGVEGASNAAFWVFTLFTLVPVLALLTALRAAAIPNPVTEPQGGS